MPNLIDTPPRPIMEDSSPKEELIWPYRWSHEEIARFKKEWKEIQKKEKKG